VTFTGNGWQTAELTIQIDPDEELSRRFALNIFRVGPDNTSHNQSTLIDASVVPWTDPKIQSISIWGV
jgi:hypothetical protein